MPILSKSIVRKPLLLVQLRGTTVFQSRRYLHVFPILSNAMYVQFLSSLHTCRHAGMLWTRLHLLFSSRGHFLRLPLSRKYLLPIPTVSQWRSVREHMHDGNDPWRVNSLARLSVLDLRRLYTGRNARMLWCCMCHVYSHLCLQLWSRLSYAHVRSLSRQSNMSGCLHWLLRGVYTRYDSGMLRQ